MNIRLEKMGLDPEILRGFLTEHLGPARRPAQQAQEIAKFVSSSFKVLAISVIGAGMHIQADAKQVAPLVVRVLVRVKRALLPLQEPPEGGAWSVNTGLRAGVTSETIAKRDTIKTQPHESGRVIVQRPKELHEAVEPRP